MDTLINRPSFSGIDIGQIESELDQHLAACRKVVAEVQSQDEPSWDSLIQPVAEALDALYSFWSPISHLNSVMNSEALREVYNRCLPKLSALSSEMGQNRELQQATQRLAESSDFASLSPAQQQKIQHDLRDFELGGVALNDKDKARFAELVQSLSQLTTNFNENVLDATNAWHKWISDETLLTGLPQSALALARSTADSRRESLLQKQKENGESGQGEDAENSPWLLTLEYPSYIAVMTYADNRALREEVYTAFSTRASDQGPQAGRFDNSNIMEDVLRSRAEIASLLGFANYAEVSMVQKMVESPAEVMTFLNELADRAVPKAREEFAQLESFARDVLGFDKLEAWDVAYASDKLKKKLHDLSDDDLKPYFPADKVIPGLFTVVGRLFGLNITAVDHADVYHPDVALYAIHNAAGELLGEFYFDNYARENKRGGAWMDVCRSRIRLHQGVQLPIAYLTCNLTPPVGDSPALLTHQEVTTLFHEFGHGLHHMLTRIDVPGVSGIEGVEWDAVELPSQFLENWCWERESLDLVSGHHETGEKIPASLLDRLQSAKNFQSAMATVRQLEFALFDMQIHLDSTPEQAANIQATLDAVRERVAVVPIPAFNRFQHGFSHIFGGGYLSGYAAGYFSYKWAEVLSADAFSRFEDAGIFDADSGKAFLVEVLEVGASRPAMESYEAFRGRKPTIDALLRHSGLAA